MYVLNKLLLSMNLNNPLLKYSDSKQYRERTDFLHKHWFIDVLSIDANIKTSRSFQNQNITINGADVDTYNNSHIMNDSFVVWRILLPIDIINSQDDINIKIQKIPKIIYIWNYIKSLPIFSFIFFILSLVIFNVFLWKIWQVLFKILIRIDIIWMLISILYFGNSFVRYMRGLININYIMYDDIKVSFINKQDLNIISSYLISWLKSTFSKLDVSDILIFKNAIYMKQSNQIYPQDLIWLLDNLLTKKYKTEDQKIESINNTLSTMSSINISDLFKKYRS